MKILWLCNVALPLVAEKLKIEGSVTGGWLTGILEELKKESDNNIILCFPLDNSEEITGQLENVKYYTFRRGNILEYNIHNEHRFVEIIQREKPDIIHIWGTEYPHALAMVNASEICDLLNQTIINIQGLISLYGNTTDHYFAGLPEKVTKKKTLRDCIRKDNIWWQREKFTKRGNFEIQALNKVKHVIGRTEWDKECVLRINPQLDYHFCNESLRSNFYYDSWQYEECEKHSIFVSQCNYTLKGFHRMLEGMRDIIKEYPDAKLYTTGNNPTKIRGFINEQRSTYYQLYIKKLIIQYGLSESVIFCGRLNVEQMKEKMLKSNVFVTPSSIENSSNSLGEAMLLGVPCVSTEVGGIRSMVTHGVNGFLYPFNETYLMECYIKKIFDNKMVAENLSRNAKKEAEIRHDRGKNTEVMKDIYLSILG